MRDTWAGLPAVGKLSCDLLWFPVQLNVDQSELEDARWFTWEEINSALQVQAPPIRGDRPAFWLPPKHALANRLITEWRDRQRHEEDTPRTRDDS